MAETEQTCGRELFRDIPREPKASKVTNDPSILALRHMFGWGTARIQQGLINLPSFILDAVYRESNCPERP